MVPADEFSVTIQIERKDGVLETIDIPLPRFVAMHQLIHAFGGQAGQIADHIVWLMHTLQDETESTIDPSLERERIRAFIHAIQLFPSDLTERISYDLINKQLVTREQAALVASAMLGRKIEQHTWRKHLNVWAKEQGLPAAHLPTGRPKKLEKS